ncbi:MAG TPA: glycosyltransferase [Bryobacteraceae bacterium]|jgi:1,2-diacylglycerol 3-beta-galactosyltransferase|nr:glycosyltransferase [Bryobacteraceae bacterium]
MPAKIDLIYIDAGGGHRAAATALSEVIRQQERPWDLRLLCIQDLLNSIDFVRKSVGIPFQDVYNIMLRHGWTLGTKQMVPVMHLLIRMSHRQQVEVLSRHWEAHRPDMVISLIPHYNRALREALDHAWPGTPFVTILTDIADYPPNFWIERLEQYVICGSDQAIRQARACGIPETHIVRTSGMILHPRFYAPLPGDRADERVRLGLRRDLPTGLVLFGGEGSTDIFKIARLLNKAPNCLQLILLCGRNATVRREVEALPHRVPRVVEGFTREVPRYMALSDFFIGKPGPGCISEALAMGLPVIVERNAWTLAHERYNADWIEEKGVGMVVRNFSHVGGAVRDLLEPATYRRYRDRVSAIRNHAVYEIPEVLERILCQHGPATSSVSEWWAGTHGAHSVPPGLSHD